MDNNKFFSWLSPVHPVMKAQNSLSLDHFRNETPWIFCDWQGADEAFWWLRAPVSNTGVNSKTSTELGTNKTLVDTVSLTFSEICITGSRRIKHGHFTHGGGFGNPALGLDRWRLFAEWFIGGIGLSFGGVTGKKNNGFDCVHHLTDDTGSVCGWFGYGNDCMRGRAQLYLSGKGCYVVSQLNGMPVISRRIKELLRVHDGAIKPHSAELVSDIVRITRVDIAYDDFEGVVGVEDVRQAFRDGDFNGRGLPPKSSLVGNWEDGNNRTFYVGSRKSHKFHRSYEKGHEIGNFSSSWVRHEDEITRSKGAGYEVPLDILDFHDEYFAGLNKFNKRLVSDVEPKSIHRIQAEKTKISLMQKLQVLKTQYGLLFSALRDVLGWDAEKILDSVTRNEGRLPRWWDELAVGPTGLLIKQQLTPF